MVESALFPKKKKKKVLFFVFSVDEYVTWKMCTTMSLFSGFYEMSKGIITLDAYDFYVIFLGSCSVIFHSSSTLHLMLSLYICICMINIYCVLLLETLCSTSYFCTNKACIEEF